MKKVLLVAAVSLLAWAPNSYAGASDGTTAPDGTCQALADDFEQTQRALRRATRALEHHRAEMSEMDWVRDEIAVMEGELERFYLEREELLQQADADGTLPPELERRVQELGKLIHDQEWQIQELHAGFMATMEAVQGAREAVQQLRGQSAELRMELIACEASGG